MEILKRAREQGSERREHWAGEAVSILRWGGMGRGYSVPWSSAQRSACMQEVSGVLALNR